MKRQGLGFLAMMLASGFVYEEARATPILPGTLLLDGVTQIDAVSTSSIWNDPELARYWTFFGNAGQSVTFTVRRLEGGLDPYLFLYAGLYGDTSDFSGNLYSFPSLIADADDTLPPNVPGPWEDPQVTVILSVTGFYTVAVTSNGSDSGLEDGNGFYDYDITASVNRSAVPDGGGTLTLLGSAIAGLAGLRRMNRARN